MWLVERFRTSVLFSGFHFIVKLQMKYRFVSISDFWLISNDSANAVFVNLCLTNVILPLLVNLSQTSKNQVVRIWRHNVTCYLHYFYSHFYKDLPYSFVCFVYFFFSLSFFSPYRVWLEGSFSCLSCVVFLTFFCIYLLTVTFFVKTV